MIQIANPIIGQEEIDAVVEVMKSGAIAHGKVVEEFEQKFAKYIGTKYAVACNSGTAALHLALMANDIGEGDEVITTPFSFAATANSILYVGAKPVFADIDNKTFNIDVNKIEEKITSKTKAIIPVHIYGQPCNMAKLIDIAYRYKLELIEDSAQAHGSKHYAQNVGTFGICGCFSFYPTKNLCVGEGGMVTTNNEDIYNKLKILRNHGQHERYNCSMLGYNYRMTNISAAVGLCQLNKLDEFNNKRIENAKLYNQLLNNIEGIELPYVEENIIHVYHQYTIRVKDNFGISRNNLKLKLYKKDVMSETYYPKLIPEQDLYKYLGFNIDNLNKAKLATEEVLSLPIHPLVSFEEINYICNEIIKIKEEIIEKEKVKNGKI